MRQRIHEIVNTALVKRDQLSSGHAKPAPATGSTLPHPFIIKVVVPDDKVGTIIGKGGSQLRGIQDRTRSQIVIPPQHDEGNPQMRTLSVGGHSLEDAQAAQQEIFATLKKNEEAAAAYASGQTLQQRSTNPVITMTVPDDKIGMLIGKGGATIKDLQARTRTRIQMPQERDPGSFPPVRTITISGEHDGQMGAKAEIEGMFGASMDGGPPSGGHPGQQYQHQYQGLGQQQHQQGMYGGWGGQQQNAYAPSDMYSQQQQYGGQFNNNNSTGGDHNDPTAYYNDFWQYASYYGEAAARQYYTSWAPPEGTRPPEGISLPPAGRVHTFA